jgi:hypothetical protein
MEKKTLARDLYESRILSMIHPSYFNFSGGIFCERGEERGMNKYGRN